MQEEVKPYHREPAQYDEQRNTLERHCGLIHLTPNQLRAASNADLQLRRAISIQPEGDKLLEIMYRASSRIKLSIALEVIFTLRSA
jgi:hypothetical protein